LAVALRGVQERRMKSLVLDGLSGIQVGHSPRMIQEMLSTYLKVCLDFEYICDEDCEQLIRFNLLEQQQRMVSVK
jgi:hypothetical protein